MSMHLRHVVSTQRMLEENARREERDDDPERSGAEENVPIAAGIRLGYAVLVRDIPRFSAGIPK